MLIACQNNKENLPGSYKLAPEKQATEAKWKMSYLIKNASVNPDKTALNYILSEQGSWDADARTGQVSFSLSNKNEKSMITFKVTSGDLETAQTRVLEKDPKALQVFEATLGDVKIESTFVCIQSDCKTPIFSIRANRQDPDVKYTTSPYTTIWEASLSESSFKILRTAVLKSYGDGVDLYNNPTTYIFTFPLDSDLWQWHTF